MEATSGILKLSQAGMIAAVAMVFLRWIWLKTRLSNIRLFMTQIAKLVEAGNLDRAIKLAGVLPSDPVGVGTLAVLRAHGAGRRMNETQLIDTFNAALPGGSVRFALGRFRGLKTAAFFLAAGAVAARLYAFPVFGVELFWIAAGAFVVLFVSAGLGAARMEHDTFEAVGVLMRLLAEPDEADPGVDAEADPNRGEGHLEIREAWEDADARTGEITDEGVTDLLLAGFRKEHKFDLRGDEMALKRVRDAAQKVVIELKSVQETQVSLPFITATGDGPLHLEATVSRKKALVFSRRAPAEAPAQVHAPALSPAEGETLPLGEAPGFAPSPSPSPAPAKVQALSLGDAPGFPPPSGKAVVCRNCAAPIPVEPELLAQIEGEFDLWTRVKTRCPQCGGTFFELRS